MNVGEILLKLWNESGFAAVSTGFLSNGGWQNLVMIVIASGHREKVRAPAAGGHRLRLSAQQPARR